MKKHKEINGKMWEAAYPFCAGCPELILSGGCAYEGNGCRFPKLRAKMPINFTLAFFKVSELHGGAEELAEKLGDCLVA